MYEYYALLATLAVAGAVLLVLSRQYESALVPMLRTVLPLTELNGPDALTEWRRLVKTEIPATRPKKGNSHKRAAAARTSMVRMVEGVSTQARMPLWALSASRTQIRDGVAGQRFLYDGKDFINHTRTQFESMPRAGHIIQAFDVLDHVGPRQLAEVFDTDCPVASYDFQLRAAGGDIEDGTYYWDRETQKFNFRGENYAYEQEVWDYNPEGVVTYHYRYPVFWALAWTVFHAAALGAGVWWYYPYTVTLPWFGDLWCYEARSYSPPLLRATFDYWWFTECKPSASWDTLASLMGVATLVFNYTAAHFAIRVTGRKIIAVPQGNRVLRWFIPTVRAHGFIGVMWAGLAGMKPRRLVPQSVSGEVHGVKMRFDFMRCHDPDNVVRWRINLTGTTHHVTIDEADVARTRVHMANTKSKVGAGSMATFAAGDGSSVNQVAMDTLIAFLCVYDGMPEFCTWQAYEPDEVPAFSWLEGGEHPMPDNLKPRLKRFMQSVVHERVVADDTPTNHRRVITARVEGPRSVPAMNRFDYMCAEEFIDRLLGEAAGQLNPASTEDLEERQTRPGQRIMLEEGGWIEWAASTVTATLNDFLKREGANEPNDPRGIGQFDRASAGQKVTWSRVCIALGPVFKMAEWYAFGKTPKQIADRIVKVFSGTRSAILTDMSRYDATVNRDARAVEYMLLRKAFRPEHLPHILAVHSKMYDRNRRMGEEVYANEYARVSGEAGTSLFNTLLVAIMVYVAYRSAGLDPEDAWDRLGIYGGDDGASLDMAEPQIEATAIRFGFKVKLIKVSKDSPSPLGRCVEFLARRYHPWDGDNNSCACTLRALSNFPITGQQGSPEYIAYAKAYSVALNDAASPYVGALVNRILVSLDGTTAATGFTGTANDLVKLSWWGARAQITAEPFPNEACDWMLAAADEELGFPASGDFHEWATGQGHWSQPPKLLPTVPEPTIPCIVRDAHGDRTYNAERAAEVRREALEKAEAARAAAEAAPIMPHQVPVLTRRERKAYETARRAAAGQAGSAGGSSRAGPSHLAPGDDGPEAAPHAPSEASASTRESGRTNRAAKAAGARSKPQPRAGKGPAVGRGR